MFSVAVFLTLLLQAGAFQFEGEEITDYQVKDAESMIIKLEFSADRRVPRNKWTSSCSVAVEVEPIQPIKTKWTKCPHEVLLVAEMDMLFLMNTKMNPEIQMIHRSQIIYFSTEEIVHASRSYFRYSNDSFAEDGKVPAENLDVTQKPMWEFKDLIREDTDGLAMQLQHPTFRGLLLQYPGNETSWFPLLADTREEQPKVTMLDGIDMKNGWRINEVRWTAKPYDFFPDINQILTHLHLHAEAEHWGCGCIQYGQHEEGWKDDLENLMKFCRESLTKEKGMWSSFINQARLSDCLENEKEPKENNIRKMTLGEKMRLKDEF